MYDYMKKVIHFTLNKQPVELRLNGDETLLWVIRSILNMTGTKFGCGLGHCGACTVLVNKEPTRSCMIYAEDVAGKDVVTIEGLAENGDLHPVQKAFIKFDALQCGYCTPGMIVNAAGLLNKNPRITRQEIMDGMQGNLCRCGAHGRIIDAIQTAADEMKGGMKK
jgi:aerobic-type carbon monoxide dehydrogenase small subunit (CoxS/CutS family)